MLPDRGRIMVEGVARSTKATRTSGKRSKSGSQLQQGGLIVTEQFVDISNVQLVCKTCGQPTRVGHRVNDAGKKIRTCRKCGADL